MSGRPDTQDRDARGALDDRYGAPSRQRRGAVLAGSALLAAVFLGWLVWVTWVSADPDVTSQLQSFDVQDDHQVTAILQVHLSDDATVASCTLSAIAYDHSVVGEKTFEANPAAGEQQQVIIDTTRRATAVESQGCTTADQNRPR